MRSWRISFSTLVLTSSVFGGARAVPERADDFAFENDRVAFRVYGPALRDKPEDSGIDAWTKRVEVPVIDKWYAGFVKGISYHEDRGEGYDFYHVGSSLGCGGIGLWVDGKLVTADVYRSARVIESTPDRAVFELEYVFDRIPGNLREVRRITLEPGDQLFRADSQFFRDGKPAKVQVAIGLTTHDQKAKAYLAEDGQRITTWETVDGAGIGTAVLLPYRRDGRALEVKSEKPDQSHALILAETDVEGRISYFAGFAWEKAGRITTHAQWDEYLDQFVAKLPRPFLLSAQVNAAKPARFEAETASRPYPARMPNGPVISADLEPLVQQDFIKSVMDRVIAFQEAAYGPTRISDWKAGTYYTGVFAAYLATKDTRYRDAAKAWGETAQWAIGSSPFYADDICKGQTMLDLYLEQKDPRYIADLKRSFEPYFTQKTITTKDIHRHGPQRDDLEFNGRNLWWWCDALYMAPPVLARMHTATGEQRYLDLLHRLYWDTVDHLYDETTSLFFRDSGFFPKDPANATEKDKIFWSRGNGWVYAGLIRTLDHLPENDPMRGRYLTLYHELTRKLVTLQQPDGLWRSWLNRPDLEQTPESSGTAFFAYGLLAGINRGWLDRQSYLPVALRAWRGLTSKIGTDGRLGFAQLVDAAPNPVRPESYIDYTHGALLLAASELYTMKLDRAQLAALEPRHRASLLLTDGTWTWYNDERAILADSHLYLGAVDRSGRVKVYAYRLDPTNAPSIYANPVELSTWTEQDDHNNPAFLRYDNTLLAVYARHNTAANWNWRKATIPSEVPGWGKLPITWSEEFSFSTKAKSTYANLARLSGEKGRIFNFYRADGFDPNVAWSDDGAQTWKGGYAFMESGDDRTRPYVKYADNGKDRIDFIYTDGHPREETNNNIYHMYYQGGAFHRSDGSVVRTLEETRKQPLRPADGTRVYDGAGPLGRGWVHDLEYGAAGTPVAAFISSPDGDEGSDLRYWISRWNKRTLSWETQAIAYAGSHLYSRERHYAGGIALDPENERVVYISANVDPATGQPNGTGRYQIYRGVAQEEAGSRFTWEQLTFDVQADNLRPFVPRQHGRKDAPCVMWMRGDYRSYTDYRTDIFGIGF